MNEHPSSPPLKEQELRALATCARCSRKIGETAIPMLWKVSLERHLVNLPAIQRQQGLGMMLGGNGGLALVMGPNEDMTVPMMDKVTVMICDECSTQSVILAVMAETTNEHS